VSENRVVLITGASRGIGAATAKLAAKRGWDVALNYLSNADAADSVAASCRSEGVDVLVVRADVADEVAVVEMFVEVAEHFGRLDALVNNAAILGVQGTFDSFDGDRLRAVVNTNVLGAMYVAREALRLMISAQSGVIVNVGSRASTIGSANEYVDYAATKGAMDTLTTGLSVEAGPHGIRVNCVRPGLIRTDMHASGGEPGRVDRLESVVPMRRGGKAGEVAAAIVWLMSDEASYVSGAMIDVSGGR